MHKVLITTLRGENIYAIYTLIRHQVGETQATTAGDTPAGYETEAARDAETPEYQHSEAGEEGGSLTTYTADHVPAVLDGVANRGIPLA
ncbi:hypothetical protein MY1884_005660 [Beauveria asiatica]